MLRDATRPAHQRLERALPLGDPGLTLDAYRRILEALYGFYEPLEADLETTAGTSSGERVPIGGRQKVWRLRADLRALGARDASLDALPRCRCLPEVTTYARALGCLYVVEGATLGGSIVARALREHFGLGPNTGASFFHGYGVETGAMWRSFLAHLEASPASPAEVMGAALDTFRAYERWLRERRALR
jgi:heme oxygenase